MFSAILKIMARRRNGKLQSLLAKREMLAYHVKLMLLGITSRLDYGENR